MRWIENGSISVEFILCVFYVIHVVFLTYFHHTLKIVRFLSAFIFKRLSMVFVCVRVFSCRLLEIVWIGVDLFFVNESFAWRCVCTNINVHFNQLTQHAKLSAVFNILVSLVLGPKCKQRLMKGIELGSCATQPIYFHFSSVVLLIHRISVNMWFGWFGQFVYWQV